MRKLAMYCGFICTLILSGLSLESCARKSGCPMNEEAVSKPKRNGTYTKGKSNLFDKQTQKKMAKK